MTKKRFEYLAEKARKEEERALLPYRYVKVTNQRTGYQKIMPRSKAIRYVYGSFNQFGELKRTTKDQYIMEEIERG